MILSNITVICVIFGLKYKQFNMCIFNSEMPMLQDLLCWMVELSFSCLHPVSAFPSRTTALSLLSLIVEIMGLSEQQGKQEKLKVIEVQVYSFTIK